ncbi:MAG: ATP-binding cassette domain-containing protein [Microthrixaceae bacterium]
MSPIILVEDLHKRFGDTHALAGISFSVEAGTVLGLLGPNGAGKTTAVRVLATLLQADAGRAEVAGFDVRHDANSVRSVIGLTGQYAAVDEKLTGAENLRMVGQLLGMSKKEALARAFELLDRFDLADAAERQVGTYSGGMRRRADLAVSLVGRPRVLFLDEPTTGLDPASRLALWDITRELVADGTTVLLTTQYLDEADELADRILVIDHGRVIEEGTADELKDRTGGRTLHLELRDPDQLQAAASSLRTMVDADLTVDLAERTIAVPVGADTDLASLAMARLSSEGIHLDDFRMERPSLDDVFLSLTASTPPNAAKDAAS